jgi:phosphoadenosine phosphosulfate reductase
MSAIELYARKSADFDAKLQRTVTLLQQAAAEHPARVVLATSLGVEDMVLADLIASHGLPIALGTLDTGMLHAQTLALVERIRAHYGITVEVYRPQSEAVVHFVGRHGERAMYESIDLRKACCAMRKLEPLARMLASRSAWVTGLRREQSSDRGAVALREVDDQGRTKFSPLAEWTLGDVWAYVAEHGVPYNPLHDEFYPSIGCAPCTRAVAAGEDFRSGRWWWESEGQKECGLHVHHDEHPAAVAALPRG